MRGSAARSRGPVAHRPRARCRRRGVDGGELDGRRAGDGQPHRGLLEAAGYRAGRGRGHRLHTAPEAEATLPAGPGSRAPRAAARRCRRRGAPPRRRGQLLHREHVDVEPAHQVDDGRRGHQPLPQAHGGDPEPRAVGGPAGRQPRRASTARQERSGAGGERRRERTRAGPRRRAGAARRRGVRREGHRRDEREAPLGAGRPAAAPTPPTAAPAVDGGGPRRPHGRRARRQRGRAAAARG